MNTLLYKRLINVSSLLVSQAIPVLYSLMAAILNMS
nr:MAG TPA: hypothetical protein [Crassvirales sp.]